MKKNITYYLLGIIIYVSPLVAYARDWKTAEQKAHNAVVQVLATHAEFNWHEPYKGPNFREGAGSGFFISKEGHFITNFHVVDQASSIAICIPVLGRQRINAQTIGVCPEADIALCQIDKTGLEIIKKELGKIHYLIFGDSDILHPTEEVLAMGYPLGQRNQKSTIGGFAGRDFLDGFSYMHITAPINPGNSGGPLLNIKGEVIGVNSAGIPSAQNIGYSVPSNDVKIILQQLHTIKLLHKPRIGFSTNIATDEHAKILGNPLPAGTFINNVIKNSISDRAGLQEGDMLYAINGYKVDRFGDVTVNWRSSGKVSLEEFLIRLPINSKLVFDIYRNGKAQKITCICEQPQLFPIRWIYPEYETQEIDYELCGGMCIMQLRRNHLDLVHANILRPTPTLQKYTDFDNHDQEVLIITKVLPGSVMHKVNCVADGDLLDKINDKQVKTLQDFRKALKTSIKTGLVKITTKAKVSTVISLDVILEQEAQSPTMKHIKKQRQSFLKSQNNTKTI